MELPEPIRLQTTKDTCKEKVEKCIVGSCNKFYHLECLKTNPNVDFYINNKKINRFRCPHHYCSGCGISGNSVQILQCVECPTSYHLKCFRADRFAVKLTKKFILCGKHSYLKKNTPNCLNVAQEQVDSGVASSKKDLQKTRNSAPDEPDSESNGNAPAESNLMKNLNSPNSRKRERKQQLKLMGKAPYNFQTD